MANHLAGNAKLFEQTSVKEMSDWVVADDLFSKFIDSNEAKSGWWYKSRLWWEISNLSFFG